MERVDGKPESKSGVSPIHVADQRVDNQVMADPYPLEPDKRDHRRTAVLIVKWVMVISTAVVGVGWVVFVAAAGHCSAFGGRCPRPSSLNGEVFRLAAMGAALAVGAPVFIVRPTRRRFLLALGIAALAGVLVGGLVMVSTAG